MSTVPVPAGLVAVIWVSESTVISAALVTSKPTVVAPVNPLPVITTVSPPAEDPMVGEIPVTSGPGVM